MRVVCIHPARDSIACGDGPVLVGSGSGDAVMLSGAGIQPHHLALVADGRGLVLTVTPGCQRVYVNARAVRERAVLHYGDSVTIGDSRILVTSDTAPSEDGQPTSAGAGHSVLRVLSGTASGQVLAVAPELRFGAGCRDLDELAFTCRVVQDERGLFFEADADGARIDGWPCRRAQLAPGDQIVLGEHHLLVEAPAVQYAAYVAALPPPEPAAAAPAEPEPAPAGIWWLIAAAAVLAIVIAALLYFRP